jgi:hypothetical protein
MRQPGELLLQPCFVAIAASEKSIAAGVRNCKRQAGVGDDVHGCQQDGMLNCEDRSKRGLDGHVDFRWE